MWGTSSSAAAGDSDEGMNSRKSEVTSEKLTEVKNISFDFEDDKRSFHGEGRTITVEFTHFYLVACYVPNSGDGLVRLDYRTKEWEPHMREYLIKLSARKPVVFTGDLNCGHLDLDVHNPGAKHLAQQAGLTPRERSAFSTLLQDTNFVDVFRYYYPDARGQFTYWSQRTFARPVNKGLRLDYFLCSRDMFPAGEEITQPLYSAAIDGVEAGGAGGSDAAAGSADAAEKDACRRTVAADVLPSPGAYDCYIIHADTVGCSDHCPVMLVLKL